MWRFGRGSAGLCFYRVASLSQKRKSYSIVVIHRSPTRAAIYLSGAVEHLHFHLIGCSLRASGEGLVTIESYQACAYQISTSL